MATALDLANRSLRKILVEASESPLEPDEYQDYYDALNDFMHELEANGIRLGFTTITGGADEVTVPEGAIAGIVANVALEVAPEYGGKVSPMLQMQAQRGLNAIRRLGMRQIRSTYPVTLPRGSGAEGYPSRNSSYYQDEAEGIITLTGNTIATGIAASATAYRVRGDWATAGMKVLRTEVAGRITNPTDQVRYLTAVVNVTATAASAVTGTFILMRNGAEEVQTGSGSLSTTRADVSFSSSVTLQPGEYVELWVQNDTDTTDITVADARLEVS